MTKRFDIFGKRDAPSAAKHRAKRRPPARTVKKSRSRKARICHGQRRDNGNGNGGSCRGAPLRQLSDDLIGHIVSFLPFRDVVRTSILSRRWRYAWTQITRFDLCPGTVLSYAAAVAAYTVNADNYRDISFSIDVAASVLDFFLSALPPVTIVSL
ncbi:F-box/FBD/LRR-repeat protein [Apostasia shenzhenica]|uniref:F-box/FBD/LRR-repeat protein n=1 Tax=Apostasia shenzhenica TaxID=1088818 RepID=A0A2I0ABQ3_9ASPA|nr:F-box/FBD/LRR-repeat protein [Apostasia shenzhenica]